MKMYYAEFSDIPLMVELNNKIYGEEWHINSANVEKLHRKNPYTTHVLKNEGVVKGFSSFYPMDKKPYLATLKGVLDKNDLVHYVLRYDEPKEVYLYLSNLIVDVSDSNHKEYSKTLIKNLKRQVANVEKMGMEIIEIGSVGMTPEGCRFLESLGFNFYKNIIDLGDIYPTYRNTPENFKDHIFID